MTYHLTDQPGSFTLEEFLKDNPELDPAAVERIRALTPGQSATFDEGAGGTWTIVRESPQKTTRCDGCSEDVPVPGGDVGTLPNKHFRNAWPEIHIVCQKCIDDPTRRLYTPAERFLQRLSPDETVYAAGWMSGAIAQQIKDCEQRAQVARGKPRNLARAKAFEQVASELERSLERLIAHIEEQRAKAGKPSAVEPLGTLASVPEKQPRARRRD